jgi:hypothetical protein
MRLRLPLPDIDVFVNERKRRMKRCFGPGGEVGYVLLADWVRKVGLLWMNLLY